MPIPKGCLKCEWSDKYKDYKCKYCLANPDLDVVDHFQEKKEWDFMDPKEVSYQNSPETHENCPNCGQEYPRYHVYEALSDAYMLVKCGKCGCMYYISYGK